MQKLNKPQRPIHYSNLSLYVPTDSNYTTQTIYAVGSGGGGYFEGLNILMKDASNISPDPANVTESGSATYTGYKTLGTSAYNVNAYDLRYNKDNNPLSLSMFVDTSQTATIELTTLGVSGLGRLLLTVATNGRLRFYSNAGGTGNVTTTLRASGTGLMYIHLEVSAERVKIYSNYVGNIVDNEIKLVYDEPISSPLWSDNGYPKATTSTGYDYYKYACWSSVLSIETIQAWYDVGPTDDP